MVKGQHPYIITKYEHSRDLSSSILVFCKGETGSTTENICSKSHSISGYFDNQPRDPASSLSVNIYCKTHLNTNEIIDSKI
jgi:hypothetical protein